MAGPPTPSLAQGQMLVSTTASNIVESQVAQVDYEVPIIEGDMNEKFAEELNLCQGFLLEVWHIKEVFWYSPPGPSRPSFLWQLVDKTLNYRFLPSPYQRIAEAVEFPEGSCSLARDYFAELCRPQLSLKGES